MNQSPTLSNSALLRQHLFAYASAMHFFFGSIAVLNTLGLMFFFYYPRPIRILILDAQTDLIVWVVVVFCMFITTVTGPARNDKKFAHVGLAILSGALGLTLLVTASPAPTNGLLILLLFLAVTGEFVLRTCSRPSGLVSKSLIPLVLVYLLAVLTVIEASAAIHYSLEAFDFTTKIGGWDAGIETQVSYASYGLLPWLYLVFLFSWAWVPLLQKLLPKTHLFQGTSEQTTANHPQNGLSLKDRILGILDPKLFLVLALAVFIGYYPYFENPPWIVGTDAYWRYYDPLVRISSDGIFRAFVNALNERHPVPLMILYATHLILNMSLFGVVRFVQLSLVIALALGMWWFLGYKRKFDFGLAVFVLSLLSITTSIGFYSSIIANWMALVVWVLFFAYVAFRGERRLTILDAIVIFFLSTAILFIHPWTWGVFAAAVVIAAVLTLVQERRRGIRSGGLMLAVIFADVGLALATVSLLSASQGWRVLDAIGDYTFVILHPYTVFWFWSALTWLTRIWSPFFSPLYFAVSIVGVFSLQSSTVSAWGKRLIFAWLFVSSVGSILVAPVYFNIIDPSGSETQLWRLLYITPLPVMAPLGIIWLSNLIRSRTGSVDQRIRQSLDRNFTGVWLGLLVLVGCGLAWGNVWERLALLIGILPILTAIFLVRTHIPEGKLLAAIILILFLFVAYDNTTRALSQLLRDPHNYRPLVNTPQ